MNRRRAAAAECRLTIPYRTFHQTLFQSRLHDTFFDRHFADSFSVLVDDNDVARGRKMFPASVVNAV
jgi:hypothetical protein